MTQHVQVDIKGAIGWITLSRPDARNALSRALLDQLTDGFTDLENNSRVRCIVLAAADPAFCAGLDSTELRAPGSPLLKAASRPWKAVTKPMVGAINGAAITGGFELALACDILVASERAWFADTHLRVSVLPGWGLATELIRAVGVRRAHELSLTGRRLPADEAYALGIVNRVVPHDHLRNAAGDIASAIADADPAVAAAFHRLFRDLRSTDTGALSRLEREHHRRWLQRPGTAF